MSRAPRKFLDRDRLVVNPAYAEWYRAKREVELGVLDFMGGGTRETYRPEEYGKALPEDGAWIRVVDVPYTALQWDVPPQSMWFAIPDPMSHAGKIMGLTPYRVRILTPGGNLWLFPHEYVLVEDITEWVGQEPNCVLHTLGGDPGLDEERMFFLQSRGIPRREAALLLLGEVRSQTFGWFELHPDLAAMFAGVGVPLWKHIADHPRTRPRRAARSAPTSRARSGPTGGSSASSPSDPLTP